MDELSAPVFVNGLAGDLYVYSRVAPGFDDLRPDGGTSPTVSLWRRILEDERPTYRARWNLGTDPRLEDAVIYLATLNPTQPACITMLGVVSLQNEDLNLAATAFEKSAAMGSPSASDQTRWASDLRAHITKSQEIRAQDQRMVERGAAVGGAALMLGLGALWAVRRQRGGTSERGPVPPERTR